MFTAGGQLDLLTFGGMRGGGGKGGGGGQSAPPQGRTYVDPVDGTVFVESPYEAMLGGGVNPDGTPRMTAAEQYNAHLRERKAGETAASAAKTAEADAAKTTAANTFTADKGTAYNNALANVRRTFELQGLNPDTYMTSDIAPKLSSINTGITDASGLKGAYSDNLGSDIINQLTTGNRTKATGAYDTMFGPNYTNTLVGDTGIDTNVNTILDEQFNPLQTQLKNAFDRNTLDQRGYDAALASLGQKRTAAQGTVRDLGQTILNEDRGYINDIVGKGRSDISNLSLNQTFDPTTYDKQARDRAASEAGSFGGELRAKVGGSKFADISELLNAGGAAQGATNPTAANTTPLGGGLPKSPFYVDPTEEQNKGRGLGNTGAF